MYEWSRRSTVEEASYQLKHSKNGVSDAYRRFRNKAEQYIRNEPNPEIGGEGDIVEIDECQIGRRKHHRGRAPNAVWIIGGIVRSSNQTSLFIERVRKRNASTLSEVITRRVNRNSTIITDGWRGYRNLNSLGFRHQVVNHSVNFVNPEDSAIHTQNIENLWRNLRRFLHGRSNYSRQHLLSYIYEFIFRKRYIDTFEMLLTISSVRASGN